MISFIAQAVCSAVRACLAISARISAGQFGVSMGAGVGDTGVFCY